MTTTKSLGLALACSIGLGLAIEGGEQLSVLCLRRSVARSYGVVAALEPGMASADVEARLSAASANAGRILRVPGSSNTIHFVVQYSLGEACGFTFIFREGRLVRLISGDYNQPGPCPGGPPSW